MINTEIAYQHQQGVDDGWVSVGAFASSHGVRGDVKLRSFTDNPETILEFEVLHRGKDGPAIHIEFSKISKGMLVVSVQGITSREDAQTLNGVELFVPRAVFNEIESDDEYYIADLIGLRVKSPSGKELGHVRAIENFGADDLVDILLKAPAKGLGLSLMVPFTERYVPKVNIAGGVLILDLDAWLEDQIAGKESSEVDE